MMLDQCRNDFQSLIERIQLHAAFEKADSKDRFVLYPISYTVYPIPYTLYRIPYTLYRIIFVLYRLSIT